jgi:RNA polymerase sigma factor (sigma-70 family)
MVVNHDDADDITQDTFIKVWQGLKNFNGDAKLYTWLYRIASNEAISFINKRKKQNQVSLDDVSPEQLEQFAASPMVEADLIQQKLHRAILTLPEKQRLVFNLKYFDEMTYDEISEVTETSVGALKASYHIAVKKIEENLNLD